MALTHKTARYKVIADSGGNRYSFFCDITGALLHTTDPIQAETQEQELETAWEDARKYFNRCGMCAVGRSASLLLPLRQRDYLRRNILSTLRQTASIWRRRVIR